ncbi:MAG: hypothetical protein IAE95_14840 [Chitinophagaceae bacterium]|nr:hypothetical protein [Chitinophagaceae bacterium]
MGIEFFPAKKYHFVVPVNKMQVTDAIASNVMDKQAVTVDILSEWADRETSNYRYFEGIVNNQYFSLNRKFYSYGRSNIGRIRAQPRLIGQINESKEGTRIEVVVNDPNQNVWWLSMLIGIALQIIFLTPFILLFSLPLMVVFTFLRRSSYSVQVREDISRLQEIFNQLGNRNSDDIVGPHTLEKS